MIPYGRQSISEDDIQAVVDVLRSDFLTQGPIVPKFEKKVCDYTTAKYAIAVNSGTSALHLACLALGLTKGDWFWTTPVSFVASANCGLYCGAQVDFVDIDPLTWNMSTEKLKEKLVQAKHEDRLPKVLVAVHFCGLPCDMEEIYVLSQEYGFRIIEDACHAIGGRYQDEPVGNCRYSDITVFSFHPVKTITTGEGGMAITNDKKLAEKMELLRSHGITRNPNLMTHVPDGPWYYQQIDLGFNYRMTDIQAALGNSQMYRLDDFVSKRHKIAERYRKMLADLPLHLPHSSTSKYSGFHLYVVRLLSEKVTGTHREIFDALRGKGIGVNSHYIPIHTQPFYQKMGFRCGDFPQAESYYAETISLPMYPDLTKDMQEKVVDALRELL
ncbi:MAG: UDP-4-amino-4,6-dideoxy-N-acetyl-beta-L-altrosamine transaminase [Nitrosopumilus sp.]|nr:UDP-4-amino-4,6-dideoxy-N-acetyl-beta-L-altrosamine transaminase [Gammaproteobacteria bacterium]MDH5665066.1 UDP-4-amino-4,6-dideoxy-N-acetyl-beta-L-altrosamine transaminase [Nitrosopumilus sp.]